MMRVRAVIIAGRLNESDVRDALRLVPLPVQTRILKYWRQEDRDRSLIGVLLARKMAQDEYGVPLQEVEIAQSAYGKPYYVNPGQGCFNISIHIVKRQIFLQRKLM